MRWRTWLYRVVPYVGRRQAEQDVHEELRLHLELERERLRDAGVPEAEASRAARRKLGNAPLIRERTRDVWGWRWLDDLGRDLRHALRALAKQRAFTLTAVATLALGIGANTAMFSIVYGVLLRPLPYPDSEAIVHIGESFEGFRSGLSPPAMPLIHEEAESFEELAAYGTRDVEWGRPDGAVTLRGATVSPSLFPLLRATPHLGRLFTAEEGREGAEDIALLSHRAWTARFASDPDIVGTVLALDGGPHTVIGVLAEGFHFPSLDEEVWTPDAIAPDFRTFRFSAMVGRLRQDVSPERAATEVWTILQNSGDVAYTNYIAGRRAGLRAFGGSTGDTLVHDVQVIRLREEIAREHRPALLALTAAIALVLLIACSNVAGLLLAFTLGLSVVVGLLFGAAPALQWSRLGLVRTLNEGSAQATGGFRLLRSSRTRAALAAAQMALALVMLVGAGLLLRSFVGLMTVDRGYDPANVLTARTRDPDVRRLGGSMTPEVRAERRAAGRRFAETLLDGMDRVERLANVTAVGLSSALPLAGGWETSTSARVVGRPVPSDPRESPRLSFRLVSPGYFDVMRLGLRGGRLFTALDGAGSPRVLVVNERLAREVFGGEPAVGQRLQIGGDDGPWEVIGVVADIRYRTIRGIESRAEAFVSVHQIDSGPGGGFDTPFIAVRTTGDPLAVIPYLREAVAEAHPRAAIDDVTTMDARLWSAYVEPRFYAGFAGGFAALALFLAAFGIYGLLSYTVAQRRREIGVRMALGAQRGDILALVVRQGAALVAAGAVVGLLAAFASSRVLESFLYGITTDDRLTFVAAPLVLIVVALVACWLPARRATRIDPIQALRVE